MKVGRKHNKAVYRCLLERGFNSTRSHRKHHGFEVFVNSKPTKPLSSVLQRVLAADLARTAMLDTLTPRESIPNRLQIDAVSPLRRLPKLYRFKPFHV